ncbi:hypothetical protein ACN9MB_13355 [Dyella kyungheensis]|uniref:hypothetical protein n=1 Tax=Dyella kyungheensis TaxID=1242174 RepID=UPI003CEFF21F
MSNDKTAEQLRAIADAAAVDAFATAMKEKLAQARAKGRSGWGDKDDCSQQHLSDMLRSHVDKGDPRDVANFCMFLYARGESINTRADSGEAVAWLVTDGSLFVDKAFTTKAHAERSVSDRKDGAHIEPLFTNPRATAVDVRDAVQRNLLAAAQTYYTRYCVDESDEDGPHWTGCSEQQSIDARELRDAISAAIASREREGK